MDRKAKLALAAGIVLAVLWAGLFAFAAAAQLMIRTQGAGGSPPTVPGGGGGGGEDPVPFGSYYVDKVNGSDSNDGRLVSEMGTGPWQTLDKALTEAEAGTFDLVSASSDIHVVFRNTGDGIYDITAHTMEGGGDNVCLGRHIRFRTHPDDAAVHWKTNPATERANFDYISMGSSNYSFEKLYVTVNEMWIASDAAASPPRAGRCWRVMDVRQYWSGTSDDFDNHGIITFDNDGGDEFEGWEIIRTRLDGNASTCAVPCGNSATLYFEDFASAVSATDSIFLGNSIGQTLYYKHPAASDPGVGGSFTCTNCVIGHRSADGRGVIYGGPNRNEYHNTLIFWDSTTERALHVNASVDGAGFAGGYANVFDHVTFWSANTGNGDGGLADLADDDQGSMIAGTDNVVTNSVFANVVPQMAMGGLYAHNTTLDYNLYQVTGDAVEEAGTGYSTLAAWISHYGQDANSVEEDAVFATTPDPDDYTTFALDATSFGNNAGSDGEDMGFYDASWVAGVGP